MKDVCWIHTELNQSTEPFASFPPASRVLPLTTLVHHLPIAAQLAQTSVQGGTRWGDVVMQYLGGDVGLWFHAGWHDQASLEVFDVKTGDVRLIQHMLQKLDDRQPEQNGDMILGFASFLDDWVLLLHVSRERRSCYAEIRAANAAVAHRVLDRV